jgi:hypothetical protein
MLFYRHKIVISCFIVIAIFAGSEIFAGNLCINEILASNTTYFAGNVKCVDLIEIHNIGSNSLELGGCFLTDDKKNVTKWEIPATTIISANGYSIFYADGLNNSLHTSFKLNTEGGFIGIYDRLGAVIDSFSYKCQANNISYGRSDANSSQFGYFQTPTPRAVNGNISYTMMLEKPVFSITGGFYAAAQTVNITAEPEATIRYTTNGAEPTATSNIYTNAITVNSTMCLRAVVFQAGVLTSYCNTQTYFINVYKTLPVISISTDPDNLFSNQTGIYVIGTNGIQAGCSSTRMNLNQDWERPVNIELYDENGKVCLNQGAGVKIFGGCSRQRFPIKSLEVFARKEYGNGSFDYKIFESEKITSFESFLIRSSSDDQQYTMFRDGLGQTLVDGVKAENQAYQPAVVYINGQYWGIQNLREKYNEAYFEEHYGIAEDNLNMVENNPANSINTKIGSASSYISMLSYLRSHSTEKNIYDYMNSQMDIESYIDYMASQIYLGADDWPGNNIRYWKANTGRYNRWRWVFYDMDQVVMLNNSRWNSMLLATTPYGGSWPNPAWSVELFKNLLKSDRFKYEFIQRITYFMNTSFSTEKILRTIDSLQNKIIDEMPDHIERWGGQLVNDPRRESWILPIPGTIEKWEENVTIMRTFAIDRPDTAINMLQRFFKLADTVNITVSSNNSSFGHLYMGPKLITTDVHRGVYFSKIPMVLNAKPKPGYRLARWEVTPEGSSMQLFDTCQISFAPTKNTSFNAIFEPYNIEGPSVIINEINYNSANDKQSGDWFELYNRVDDALDISGWIINDENYKHTFEIPENIVISPYGYYVLCQNSDLFDKQFPGIKNRIGDFTFGLGNGNDVIKLYDHEMTFIDSVRYSDNLPWPQLADGHGRTLALTSPEKDNDLPGSWSDLYKITPADTNILKSEDPLFVFDKANSNAWLQQNYPNPCDYVTNISFGLNTYSHVSLTIHDLYGRRIKTTINENIAPGTYKMVLDVASLTSGTYFYTLRIDNKPFKSMKMMIIR